MKHCAINIYLCRSLSDNILLEIIFYTHGNYKINTIPLQLKKKLTHGKIHA